MLKTNLAPLLLVGQPQALVPLQRVLPQVLQVVLVLLPGWMLQVLLLSLQVLLLLLLLALAWEPGPAEAGQPGQPELALALQVQEQSSEHRKCLGFFVPTELVVTVDFCLNKRWQIYNYLRITVTNHLEFHCYSTKAAPRP